MSQHNDFDSQFDRLMRWFLAVWAFGIIVIVAFWVTVAGLVVWTVRTLVIG